MLRDLSNMGIAHIAADMYSLDNLEEVFNRNI
jgi:hypothetical protein